MGSTSWEEKQQILSGKISASGDGDGSFIREEEGRWGGRKGGGRELIRREREPFEE